MSVEIDYNAVAAYERSKAPQAKAADSRTFTIVLLAAFFIILMAGMAIGVAMYRAVADNQLEANAARMQAGLLASNVRSNDMAGAIGVGDGPEGRALVLTEHGGDGDSYEMRMYLYNGNVVQEYSTAGSAYSPERAQALIASTTFDFELRGDLLVIYTDQGATNVALRSYQGGAA